MSLRWLRPFGQHYLVVFALGMSVYAAFIGLSGPGSWGSESYRFLFDWLPRRAWAFPWAVVALACWYGLIANTPRARRVSLAALIIGTAGWMFGLLTAVILAPHTGSPGGPIVWAMFLALHLRVARVSSEDRTFWEQHPGHG